MKALPLPLPSRHRLTLAALGLSLAILPVTAQAAEPPRVVVTIPPVKALADAVLAGIGESTALLSPGASPHTYALKPSDARALSKADVVVWMGPALEGFMPHVLESQPKETVVLTLSEAPGVTRLPLRADALWQDEHDHDEPGHEEPGHEEAGHADHKDHDHKDHDHKHGAEDADEHDHHHDPALGDGHVWLDPVNGAAMATALAETLAARDPERAAQYRANSDKVKTAIAAADADIKATLAPVKERSYVVFHDAYQYFETHYGLHPAGAIAVDPGRGLGAKHLSELRERVSQTKAACLFAEPQFSPKALETLAKETGARVGTLDPLAVGKGAVEARYADGLRQIATALSTCLSGSGRSAKEK